MNNQTNHWGIHLIRWACGKNLSKPTKRSPFGRGNTLLSMLIHIRFNGPVKNGLVWERR